jgi:hypothetical protein
MVWFQYIMSGLSITGESATGARLSGMLLVSNGDYWVPSNHTQIRTLAHIFTSRPELLETGETTANHLKLQREEAQRLERDKTNADPRTGGLFKGKFKPKPPVQKPVLDLEDNVYRCPQCSWELEEDSGCVRCGYHPDDASVASSETGAGESDPEDNSEMSDYLDDEAEDGFDDADDLGWNAFGVPAAALPPNLQDHLYGMRDIFGSHRRRIHSLGPGGRAPGRLSDYEEDDDEDDMDSFIEDDINGERGHGSESTVVGGHEPSTQDHYDESPHGTEASMSDDTSNSLEGDDSMSETDEDDNEDGGEDRIQPPPNHRMPQFNGYGSRFSRPFQSSAHLYCTARLPPYNAGSSAHVAIDIDDESDDDEGPVDPVRRARGRRDHGFSAY